jgi:hypothetical protein
MIDLSRGNADAANYVESLSGPAISIRDAQEIASPPIEIRLAGTGEHRAFLTQVDCLG